LDECKIGADDAEFRVLDLGTGPGIVALRFAQLFPKVGE
jgi:methylase of polypeptide subunit release factors